MSLPLPNWHGLGEGNNNGSDKLEKIFTEKAVFDMGT